MQSCRHVCGQFLTFTLLVFKYSSETPDHLQTQYLTRTVPLIDWSTPGCPASTTLEPPTLAVLTRPDWLDSVRLELAAGAQRVRNSLKFN